MQPETQIFFTVRFRSDALRRLGQACPADRPVQKRNKGLDTLRAGLHQRDSIDRFTGYMKLGLPADNY
jgi:hypothetical protein